MTELNIHSAVTPRELMARAVDLLGKPAASDDPVSSRWVIQPGRLWERDLRRRLADQGMAACLTFGSLRLALERAFRLFCPDTRLQDENQLFWVVLDLLDRNKKKLDAIGLAEASAPRQWLTANTHDPSLSNVQLARMLSAILDDHATYRPDEVLEWLGGGVPGNDPDELWIAPLAKTVWGSKGSVRPLALQLPEFRTRLEDPALDRSGGPAQIMAILTGAQPNAYLEALGAMSLACPVHLLVLETSERGMSDHLTTWRAVREDWKSARKKMHREYKSEAKEASLSAYATLNHWLVPGTLQAFWGGSGIKLQHQLVELEESLIPLNISFREDDRPQAPDAEPGSSRLTVLQDDIRVTRELRASGARLDRKDASLVLVNATSPLRELEGARDAIRAALENDRTLQSSDVLMILADTARYAPLLPAVFGSGVNAKAGAGPDGLERIPWHLADRSLRTDSDTMAALQDIMGALRQRITLPIVADLLSQPAVQGLLGFSQDETLEIIDCLKEAGFRWGLTRKDREADNQPGKDDGMWTLDFALRRLAAGFAHPDSVRDPVGGAAGVTPLPAFEGLASSKLAAFLAWASALESARNDFVEARPMGSETAMEGTWLGWMNTWVPRLMETGGEREGHSVWISRATRSVAEGAKLMGRNALFSSASYCALFSEAAAALEVSLPLGQGIGGMTVASPRMARALPAKVIVVVGLSDNAWPRQDDVRRRGLLRKLLPGDRLKRDDDRLTTLEWVLAAGQSLVWTWQGRQDQTGEEVPPSVVVGELLDVCRATFKSLDSLVRVLRMHGFDPRVFDGTSVGSYDRIAARGATRLSALRDSGFRGAEAEWMALPLPGKPLGLAGVLDFAKDGSRPAGWNRAEWAQLAGQLVKFWKLPCHSFLKSMEVHVEDEYEMLPDREALALDPLESWGLRDELLATMIESPSCDVGVLKRRLVRGGRLPPGAAGDKEFSKTVESAGLITAAATAEAGLSGRIVSLTAMDWKEGPLLVRVTAGSIRAEKLLAARIEQLALSVMSNAPVACTVIGKPKSKTARSAEIRKLPEVSCDDAREELRKLTAFALLGLTFPLPYFPGAAAEYMEEKDCNGANAFFMEGKPHSDMLPESRKPACRIAFRGLADPLWLAWPKAPPPAGRRDLAGVGQDRCVRGCRALPV